MRSERLKEALKNTEMLSMEIRKRKTLYALNEFIDERINGTTNAIQPLTEDIPLTAVVQQHEKEIEAKNEELKTDVDNEGVIKTEEMCYVPFPFVQSETLSYKDGRRVVTIFYPDYRKRPVKIMEYSADKRTVKTTTFDRNGTKKLLTVVIFNGDGTRIEERTDYRTSIKEVKFFNQYNVAVEISSFVEDRLSFKMNCDNSGHILTEKSYFACSPQQTLKKEIIYNSLKDYTVNEYDYTGNMTSSKTIFVKK